MSIKTCKGGSDSCMNYDFPASTRLLRLVDKMCEQSGTSLAEIRGIKRCKKHQTKAMKEICLMLRSADWSYPVIGDFLHRDHTTIMHHVVGK